MEKDGANTVGDEAPTRANQHKPLEAPGQKMVQYWNRNQFNLLLHFSPVYDTPYTCSLFTQGAHFSVDTD